MEKGGQRETPLNIKKTASKLRPQCAGDRVPQRWMKIEPGRNRVFAKIRQKKDI